MNVPYDDRGLLLGDGLFETVLARDGELALMDQHVRRMQAGAGVLGLPAPAAEDLVAAALGALSVASLQAGRAAVRLTLTAGSGGRGLDRPAAAPRLFAAAAPAPAPERDQPLALAVVDVRRNDLSPASGLKTLSYMDNVLARRQAQAAGAEEAVMLNTAGELACAAAANLFWLVGERLFTPALVCGVLPGVMRAEVLARAGGCGLQAQEVRAGPDALERADAVFLTSSLIGVRPAARLGGRRYDSSAAIERLRGAISAFA